MTSFTRTDNSLLGRWWWTVDRWMLAAVLAVAAIGAVMAMAASPPVAERMGFETFHFARRQLVFLPLSLSLMLATSLLSSRGVRRAAVACLAVSLALMALTPLLGVEINGATRWIGMAGFSLQPSEFAKPGLAIVAAWMFAEARLDGRFPGSIVATGLAALTVALLLMQPDVGMALVTAAVWGIQFFLAGLPMVWVVMIAAILLGGGVGSYFAFDHVRIRVDRFLDPAAGDSYQVSRALEAFRDGGILGRGPGEGRVKEVLPDAHSDFVLAVVGEEFGLIACLLIVGLFAFMVLRGFSRVFRDDDLFVILAVAGLMVQFGLQSLINLGSAVHLIPPKGMTLPFISYGGSSVVALGFALGAVLALTRRGHAPGGTR